MERAPALIHSKQTAQTNTLHLDCAWLTERKAFISIASAQCQVILYINCMNIVKASAKYRPCMPLFIAYCFAFFAFFRSAEAQQNSKDLLEQFRTYSGVVPGQQEMNHALKEALGRGVQHAVTNLGRTGGFLTSPDVKILLPEKLATVEKTLRAVNQGPLVDEFLTNMNRAAEIAVAQTGPILGDAVQQLTLEEARAIIDGPNDAATRYFQKVSQRRLRDTLRPIISEATAKAGATGSYKAIMQKADMGTSLLRWARPGFDLDAYVLDKSLEGLFLRIAEQEKQIRQNPAAQTTELLRKVFGKKLPPTQ
jgi:hypothetical protein